MKKIISAILTVVVFAMPAVSFAAMLNNDTYDLATLRVANKTTNPAGTTTAWAPSTNASAGQVVSFAIYYHNTTDPAATNLRVRLTPQSTGSGTTQAFTATVSADNTASVFGTATVYLSSTQSLNFINSTVSWYPNQSGTITALPFGQTGAELFDGVGLNLGSIASGWAAQGSITVSFQVSNTAVNQPTVSISADSTNISQNNGTTIRWYPNNATSCSTSGGANGWAGSQNSTGGSFNTGALTGNTTYSINCTNSNGSSSMSSVTVYVGSQQSGTSQPSVTTTSANPSNDFAVLGGYVNPNGTNDTTRWFEWGSSSSFGNTTQQLSQGSLASNYSATLSGLNQNATYYYRAVARNSQGTVYGSTFSFTTLPATSTTSVSGSAPAVTTLFATEITRSTARLSGLVFASGSQPSTAFFQWGETASFGNTTESVNVGNLTVVRHDRTLSGLADGRTYYYRIVAENTYGRVYGTTISFTSGAPIIQNTTTIIRQPVTRTVAVIARGISTQSLATITINGGAEVITNGEKRAYHVTWRNTNGSALKNVVVRVTLPKVMNFESATIGAYSKEDNTVTVEVKDLVVGASGETFVFATADNGLVDGQLVVITASMVYTTISDIQGDAIAYTTHKGVHTTVSAIEKETNNLGANLFGAGEFLPTTLFGWMLLFILVLILVLLGNHVYGRFSGSKAH